MSTYSVVQLEMNDAECIKSTLTELGLKFQEHEQAVNLSGYGGDRNKANIVVKNGGFDSYAPDVGFLKNKDGNYSLTMGESYSAKAKKFIQSIKQTYGKQKAIQAARKLGYMLASQTVDQEGLIKIKMVHS